MSNIKMIVPQPTEQKPLTVSDYPYGFRLRTQAQYWVETVERKGQRIVFRTLNPKTQRWNKEKKGTYSDLLVVYRNLENGHIENTGLSFAYTDESDLTTFLQKFPESDLSAFQKEQITLLRAIIKTRKHVKVNIVTNLTEQETQKIEDNNKQTSKDLHKILRHYYLEEKKKGV